MAASVLNTHRATEVSLLVVRTFVKLRQLMEPPAPKKKRSIGFAPWVEEEAK